MFSNKVVIITGAGSGIGRAATIKMASLGATVAITDINASGLSETISLCNKSADQNHIQATFDVGSSEKCNQFIADVVNQLGRIDYVLNNAGINPTAQPTENIPDEYWDKLMNTNLKGTFNITRACIPHLKSGASVVNISSICGVRPTAELAVYCATKYGVIGFTKCVALELGSRGIRVNVVAPGHILTPTNMFVKKGVDAQQEIIKNISIGRLGQPEDVVQVISFLFSDASRYMNGSVVEINGGLT
jgi:NAD(P)-dependent dehydrogenase (short-subunit alcohol dehydrogenase family)